MRVYISVGSNVDRGHNVGHAVAELRAEFGILVLSNVYRSKAVGFDGDDFYNLVAGFDTGLTLTQVRERLRAIEQKQGRRRGTLKIRSRTLDLDVLLYGDCIKREPGWDIPRCEITLYAFVLGPLSEIAGTRVHPETGVSFAEMWRQFDHPDQALHLVELDLG